MSQNKDTSEASSPVTSSFRNIFAADKTLESITSSLDRNRKIINAKTSHQRVQSEFQFGASPLKTPAFNLGIAPDSSTAKPSIFSRSNTVESTVNKDLEQSTTVKASPLKTFDFGQSPFFVDNNKKLVTENANLSKELKELKEQVIKLEAEKMELKKNGVLLNLKRIFNDEVFKDFEVNVNNEKSYKVHKILFAARSSVIADMIRITPDAENLDLHDIPLPIFEILLNFIYNDTIPDDDERLIEIYAAAGKLNIVELKNAMSSKLIDKINDKNAFKILEMSNKYGNDELRIKAFEDIKKILSGYNLPDELSKNPEKIKVLLELKKKMDEEFEKMKQDIEGSQVIDEEHWNDAAGSPGGNSEVVEEN